MKLYHFTDKQSAESISKEGLTKGVLVSGSLERGLLLEQNFQWLVDRPTLGKNTWLEKSYRNVMITVEIPDKDPNLMNPRKWKKLIRPLVGAGFWICYSRPECNHWWLYKGKIPAEWIKEVE